MLIIINDMISKSKKTNYYRIIDREEAVTLALRLATNKDIVQVKNLLYKKYFKC